MGRRPERRTAALALPWIAALMVSLAAGGALFWPWLDPRFAYVVDDGFNHLLRLGLLDHLLRQGERFPRWWPDLTMGYGYPLFTFYSPGAYYLAELYHLLGASLYRAWHLVAITSVALGTAGAFALAGLVFRSAPGAAVAAVAYVGAPYPFVTNLYNRSAFPEALGLGLLPWLLAAGWLAVRRPSPVALLGMGLVVAALILTHSLSALIGLAVLILWLAAAALDSPPTLRRGAAGAALGGLALGLALSAFFWLPAFAERAGVHSELGATGNLSATRWLFDPLRPDFAGIETSLVEPYRVSPGAPFDLHWLYPHATSGLLGPPKPGLGQAAFAGLAVLAGFAFWLDRRGRPASVAPSERGSGRFPWPTLSLCLAAPPLLWLLTTRWAGEVWRGAPLLWVLQFPWRLYGLLALTLALAGAGVFVWLARRGQPQWVLAALLTLFLAVNGRAAHALERRFEVGAPLPDVASRLRSTEGQRLGGGTTSGGEFLPLTVALPDPVPPDWSWADAYSGPFPSGGWIAGRVWPSRGAVRVRGVQTAPSWTAARVVVAGSPEPGGAAVAFRTLVFPGWRAYVDGRPVPLRPAPYDPARRIGHGFAVVDVPPGEHLVQLVAGPTVWSAAGGALGYAGLVACAAALAWPRLGRRWRASRASNRRLVGAALGGGAILLAGAYVVAWLPVWRPPMPPAGAGETLMLDALDAAPAGSVTAPSGRPYLAMAPPAELRLALDVPPRAVFHAGLGVDPRPSGGAGAGVRFEVEVADGATGRHTLLAHELESPTERTPAGAEPRWRFVEVDLGAFAGRRVTLVLRAAATGLPPQDVAGGNLPAPVTAAWATPHVFADASARYPPPPPAFASPASDFAGRPPD